MKLALIKSEWLDWYVLEGGRNWACVEGTSAEWRSIAEALQRGVSGGFTRCRAHKGPSCWELYSPRNRSGANDCILVEFSEAAELAGHILSVVGEAPRQSSELRGSDGANLWADDSAWGQDGPPAGGGL